jgi:hypothetical protein
MCGKGFAFPRDLNRHEKAHARWRAMYLNLPVEKIPCEIAGCSKTFCRQDYLIRHLRNKHGYPQG